MRGTARVLMCLVGLVLSGLTGCNVVPRSHLAQAQHRTMQLYQQNQQIAAERDRQQQLANSMSTENQGLKRQFADAQALIDNLKQQNVALQGQNQDVHKLTGMGSSPLPADTQRALEDLKKRYPEFEFDANTGVSKFDTDLVFESGSDSLRPQAAAALKEFAAILGNGTAKELNILVVGHTDDRRVVKPSTKVKHPDNWYLSAHRAIAVREALHKYGIQDNRLGVAGYGPYQPVEPNKDEKARAKNRRVEIFVLAPNASMVGWDGETLK